MPSLGSHLTVLVARAPREVSVAQRFMPQWQLPEWQDKSYISIVRSYIRQLDSQWMPQSTLKPVLQVSPYLAYTGQRQALMHMPQKAYGQQVGPVLGPATVLQLVLV